MQFVLYAVFVLSGAAGLIYESIWSRYLGLFVGHSAYAQIIVLTIFLGGMSFGAFAAGRWSERLKEPLVTYAFIELGIGAIGFIFHNLFVATTALAYDSIFPHLAGSPLLLVIVKWTIASLLILPQSVLLGMTFPLMSAGVLRLVRQQPGRVLSLLYFANSLGASAGVLFAGFYLLAAVGLEGTLLAAVGLNAVVFLATLSAVRLPAFFADAEESAVPPAPIAAEQAKRSYEMVLAPAPLGRTLLIVAFGTAIASFVYEISWIRLLSLVLGSATHSFELMLSAFILGLALGAYWAHAYADKFKDPLRALGRVQWLMGFAAMATIPLYLWSFRWTQVLVRALSQTDGAYMMFGITRYAFCLIVMLPATFFAGITLPVITKLLIDSGRGERSVGTVYAVNTLGSIVGVILAGLVLMPLLGLKSLLILGAVTDMGLGVWLLQIAAGSSAHRQRWAMAAAMGVLAMTVATVVLNTFERTMLASGVYRYGVIPDPASRKIVYYRDGRTATVSVGLGARDKSVFIATNGKPDASLDTAFYRYDHKAPRRYLGGDVSTQVLLPMLTLAHAPQARLGAVIGEGSGMTSHLLLGSPYLQSLTTIEIEPSMIAGSRFFTPVNDRVFNDPRSHFAIEDAKSFFATQTEKFDLIVSEPSNPWVSGVSGLFTVEFYARVKNYLTPDGVFGQWLHLYEINDGLVLSVLAAIHRNFPSYQIYMTSNADILIVASNRSTLPPPDWSVFAYPMIEKDLGAVVHFAPAALEGMHVASREALAPMFSLALTSPNSDYVPVLDLGAEKARFMHEGADGISGLNSERFDFMSAYFGQRVPFDTGTMTSVPSIPRTRLLAAGAVLHRRKTAIAQDTVSGLAVIEMFQRRSRLENGMASGRPPADWRSWTLDALAVEKDLHGGTAGVADEDFYKGIFAYLAAQHAPATARQALAYMHALARFDFPAMSALADSLNPAGIGWVPVDDLRDGGTIAKLKIGDSRGAHKFWKELEPRTTRPADHVRSLLINAYTIETDKALHRKSGEATPSPAPKTSP